LLVVVDDAFNVGIAEGVEPKLKLLVEADGVKENGDELVANALVDTEEAEVENENGDDVDMEEPEEKANGFEAAELVEKEPKGFGVFSCEPAVVVVVPNENCD
jgi:hypothetical protein